MASLNKLDDTIDSLSDALGDILKSLKRKHLDLQKTQNLPAARLKRLMDRKDAHCRAQLELIATIDQLQRETKASEDSIAAELHAHSMLHELSALVAFQHAESPEHIDLLQQAA